MTLYLVRIKLSMKNLGSQLKYNSRSVLWRCMTHQKLFFITGNSLFCLVVVLYVMHASISEKRNLYKNIYKKCNSEARTPGVIAIFMWVGDNNMINIHWRFKQEKTLFLAFLYEGFWITYRKRKIPKNFLEMFVWRWF